MNDVSRVRHSVWECKYHLVWIPKCRRKVLYGQLRRELGAVFPRIGSAEGMFHRGRASAAGPRARADIDSSEVCRGAGSWFLKGKSAIHIARVFSGRRRNFVGQHFWARGCYVSTVGKDEQAVRQYIKEQEVTDRPLDQLKLDG